MRIVCAVLALAAWLPVPASPAQEPVRERLPVPDAAAQKAAEETIRDIYKDEYARTSATDRIVLSQELIKQGIGTRDDPNARFVLFREARDLAAQAGDPETALKAIDEMDRYFRIDAIAMKSDLLIPTARNAQTVREAATLAAALLRLADQANAFGDFEAAAKAVAAASASAKQAKDAPLIAQGEAASKKISDLKGRFPKLKSARSILETAPDDPDANFEVGRYLCLGKDDWTAGLPFLTKASDPAFKAAATLDLAGATDPLQQVAVGDAWWDLAEKQPGGQKAYVLVRAELWYAQAHSNLVGLTRTKIRKKLDEIRNALDAKRSWVDVTDGKLFSTEGKAGEPIVRKLNPRNQPNGECRYIQKLPDGEFDGVSLRVRLGRNEGVPEVRAGVVVNGVGGSVYVTENDQFASRPDGYSPTPQFNFGPEKCDKRETHVITVLISRGQYVLCLDGQEMTRIKAPKERFEIMGLFTQGAASFDQIRLRRKE